MSKTTMESVRRVAKHYGVNLEGAQIHESRIRVSQELVEQAEDWEGFEVDMAILGVVVSKPMGVVEFATEVMGVELTETQKDILKLYPFRIEEVDDDYE